MTNYVKRLVRLCAVLLALAGSSVAHAQWQGTWDTRYGEVNLQQTQKYVYGDYGTWGTIEGMASPDGTLLRGVYRRNDNGDWGYFEWKLRFPTYFEGRWQASRLPVPIWNMRGTKWSGKRINDAVPSLRVYPYETGSVDAIGGFVGRQERKYVEWMSRLTKMASSSPRQVAENEPAPHPWGSRMPLFKTFPASFQPRYFEVGLTSIFMMTAPRREEIYGDVSIFAACEKARGSFSLVPFGGRKNKVFSASRGEAVSAAAFGEYYSVPINRNSGTLRFPFDRACLADPNSRFAIQIQTNLAEKDLLPRGDDRFGYQAFKFYIDQVGDEVTIDGAQSIEIEKHPRDRNRWTGIGRLNSKDDKAWIEFDFALIP